MDTIEKEFFRFRMVVIETTSQILETRMHEMHLEQTTGGNSFSGKYLNTLLRQPSLSHIGSTNFINPNHRSSIHIHNCPKLIDDAEEMTASISDGYMRLKPLLYPCTIEFSLMCLTVKRKPNHWIHFSHSLSFSI